MIQHKETADPLAEQLEANGFFVTQLPLNDDPAATLLEFGKQFCEPLPGGYSEPNRWVVEVRPRQGYDSKSYAGAGEFALHTDSVWLKERNVPRLVFLFCLRPDSGGGGRSLLVDTRRVLERMTEFEISTLLNTPLTFRSHFDATQFITIEAPMLERVGGYFHVRFRRDLIVGQPPLAVVRFQEIADQLAVRFHLSSGQVLCVNNRRMLHGREQLQSGLASTRLLLRLQGR